MAKTLQQLLQKIEYQPIQGELAVPIRGIAYDSRRVTPGTLFVCLPGAKTDGHSHIGKAIASGAAGLVIQAGNAGLLPAGAPTTVAVPNPRLALAQLATNFYDCPAEALQLVGVTGTNGKSTTVHLLNTIHRAVGLRSGVIGTLAYVLDDESRPAPHTTPQALELQALLAEMRERGISHVAMEVSSHALEQHRADGCRFEVAIFSNLTRDHLDYHGTEAAYLGAKLRLFSDPTFLPISGERVNLVNADDPAGAQVAQVALGQVITYGIETPAQVQATEINFSPTGTSFKLCSPWGNAAVTLPLLGRFNVYNTLAALSGALAQGIALETVMAALAGASAPIGRFQQAPSPLCTVVVDYAHTQDGLEKVLATARAFCRGRLIVMFGCGGDRDPGKRPVMGELASRLADLVVVTSDNSRSEAPEQIIEQILAGIPAERRANCLVEPDREKAIYLAIAQARPDDLVLLAGKGHETYQIFADRTIHFDDREVAQAALADRMNRP